MNNPHMASIQGNMEEENISLREYWLLILQNRGLIIALTCLVTFFAGIYAFTQKPIFQAQSAIDVRPERLNLGQRVYQPQFYYTAIMFIKTQMEVAQSQAVAEFIVQTLGKETIVQLLGLPQSPDEYSIPQLGRIIRGGMKTYHRKDTFIIDLKYLAPTPLGAAAIANAWAKAIIEYNRESEIQMSKATGKALSKQIEQLQQSIAEKERRLAQMSKSAQIQILDKEINIAQEKLDRLHEQLLKVQEEKIEKASALNRIQQSTPEALPEVIQNAAIQQLQISCDKARSAYREKLKIFKEGWPEVQELKAQMDEICGQLNRQIQLTYERLLKQARSNYQAVIEKEKRIQEEFNRAKSELDKMNEANKDYFNLKSELKIERETLAKLQQRAQATKISESGNLQTASIIRIVEYASPPKAPIRPKKARLIAMGFVVGIFSSIGLVFLLSLLDNKIHTHEDLQKISPYRFLTIIPHKRGQGDKVVEEDERAVRHAIRFLIEYLTLLAQRKIKSRVIMITSPQPKEGKTFVASNIAIHLALTGKRVLLIDTDIHNPSIHSAFFINRRQVRGLRHLLMNGETTDFEEFKWFENHHLCVIPVENYPNFTEDISFLLEEERFLKIIERAKKRFDYIILDTAPINVIPESIRVAQWVDGILLVIRADFTTKTAVEMAIENLEKIDTLVLGVVLNDVNLVDKYSYYNYYKKYKEYYGYGQAEKQRPQKPRISVIRRK